jgi:hypothetical protein
VAQLPQSILLVRMADHSLTPAAAAFAGLLRDNATARIRGNQPSSRQT